MLPHGLNHMRVQIHHIFIQLRIKLGIIILGKHSNPFSHNSVKVLDITPVSETSKKFALAITIIVRNESLAIKEWLDFHLNVGFEHVYLYDNESTDNTLAILKNYIDAGKVTVFNWPLAFYHSTQIFAYAHSVALHRKIVTWMAFIDIDEFIYPNSELKLAKILDNYSEYSAIQIPWRTFGPSGNIVVSDLGVVFGYTEMADLSKCDPGMYSELTKVKSIVKMRDIKYIKIHDSIVNGNTLKSPIDINLNHYITKSKLEFEEKLKNMQFEKYSSNNNYLNIRKRIFQFLNLNTITDRNIIDYMNKNNYI